MLFRTQSQKTTLGTTDLFQLRRLRVDNRSRATHTYVVGTTGRGKSKLLEHILYQDIVSGHGCGVLDPHSDLVADLLHNLHNHPARANAHWNRILYFDPTRTDYLVPFNVLRVGMTPYATAQNVVEAFRRTWPRALAAAPRFANIATAAILTLIATDLTLVELPRLLTDAAFRERLLARVTDPEVLAFWRDRYAKWGRNGPLMVESLLNKVTALTLNPQLRLILGAVENRLDFRRIMDEGKILLVDLGRCDGETRRLLGSLIVTGLEQAAHARQDTGIFRRPFYFCMDEFQDFCANEGASQTLAQTLSECRKFGLHLTLAHQSLGQINERLKSALGNIQLKIVFGVARQDAEALAPHLFQVGGQRPSVPSPVRSGRTPLPYYALQEEWERTIQTLQNLPPRVAMVRSPEHAQVARLKTIILKYPVVDLSSLEGLRRNLARQTGIACEALHQSLQERGQRFQMPPPEIRQRRNAPSSRSA
ncbi:MAG: TraM recognition domain-containing protein [Anaerolineales bacterium]|nr:TraM recognition domain-containing protein [Anaerolineales bacterium]